MEQAAEPISSADSRWLDPREWHDLAAGIWDFEVEGAVRALVVVVVDVGPQRALELAASKDQNPVEALAADRTYEAFGVCVRVRRSDRRPDDARALGLEDLIERRAELRVAVVEHEPQGTWPLGQIDQQVARLLHDPRAAWAAGAAARCTRRVLSSMKNRT